MIHQQATKLKAAVDSNAVEPWAIYSMWLRDTQRPHASGNLAGQYAPTLDSLYTSSDTPDSMDPALEAHSLLQVHILMLTSHLLTHGGLSLEFARRIEVAFFAI